MIFDKFSIVLKNLNKDFSLISYSLIRSFLIHNNKTKLEVIKISDQKDLRKHYRSMGKKLKEVEETSNKKTKEKMKKSLEKLSTGSYLPKDLANYLLDLKQKEGLPVSILPESIFQRPIFFGREDFFKRLASELVTFGLAYQRVYLQPIKLSKLAELFHKHRPWWRCDIKDIETAINILMDNSIIQRNEIGFLFEPLAMSSEIQDFLKFINKGISEVGEISISTVQQLVPWDDKKITNMIELLSSNQVCFWNKKEKSLYFPDFKRS